MKNIYYFFWQQSNKSEYKYQSILTIFIKFKNINKSDLNSYLEQKLKRNSFKLLVYLLLYNNFKANRDTKIALNAIKEAVA